MQSHDVRYRASLANNQGYLIAYNYSNVTQTVTFSWNSAASTISRVNDTASAPTLTPSGSGVRFTDTFGPYQVRIYVLTP